MSAPILYIPCDMLLVILSAIMKHKSSGMTVEPAVSAKPTVSFDAKCRHYAVNPDLRVLLREPGGSGLGIPEDELMPVLEFFY